MVEIIQPELMTEREARACVECIRAGLEDIRKDVLDLYERQGWRSLGYQSWRECVTAEFGQGERELYRALEAGRVERVLTNLSNESVQLKESHAHALAPLVKKDPETARQVLHDVSSRNQHVTATKIREAVKEHFSGDCDDDDGREPDPRIADLKSAIRTLERCQKARNDVFTVAFRNLAGESRKVLREMEAGEAI